jgi:hypothetical protein
MSDTDNKIIEKTDEDIKLDDNNKIIQDTLDSIFSHKELKTDILNNVIWESKLDQYIFDSLPLTMKQKEDLLLSLYKT